MLKVLIQVHQTFNTTLKGYSYPLILVEKVIHIFFILYCFMSVNVWFVNKHRMCMCQVTYENNDSCKQRLVSALHIECNFNLQVFFFFFHLHSLPPFIINHREILHFYHFLFVSTFAGTFWQELSCKCAARLI